MADIPSNLYLTRTFWSPDKRHLVTVHYTTGDIVTLQDDNGREWEATGETIRMEDVPKPAETPAPPLEKPLAFNVLDEIRERHERVRHLLDSSQREHLGSMALNDAHADRNYLLGLVPPEWTYRPVVKTSSEGPL